MGPEITLHTTTERVLVGVTAGLVDESYSKTAMVAG